MKMKHLKKILIAASVVCCLAFAVPALADEAPAPEETEQEIAGEDEEKEVETADQQEPGEKDPNGKEPGEQDPGEQDPASGDAVTAGAPADDQETADPETDLQIPDEKTEEDSAESGREENICKAEGDASESKKEIPEGTEEEVPSPDEGAQGAEVPAQDDPAEEEITVQPVMVAAMPMKSVQMRAMASVADTSAPETKNSGTEDAVNAAGQENGDPQVAERVFSGVTYYIKDGRYYKDKAATQPLTGQKKFKDTDGKYYWYMFESDGTMVKGFYDHNETTNPNGGKKTCYYDGQGHMLYGQKKITGSDGKAYWYMFRLGSGAMVKDALYEHDIKTNPVGGEKTTYYDLSGRLKYGQKKITGSDGKAYWYMFRNGSGAMVKADFFDHDENTNPSGGAKTCYYDGEGHMLYGQKKIGGKWYMFRLGSGAMVTYTLYKHNSVTNPSGGEKIVYYDPSGVLQYGQKKLGGYWYMFRYGSGAMVHGEFFEHTEKTNPSGGAKTCYYDEDGHMVYGTQVIDGKTYVFKQGSGALDDARTNYPQACEILDKVGWTLRKAYDWAYTRTYLEQSTTLTSREYADYTFRTGKGNCYGMAAVFYEMAKALGYTAYQMTGKVPLRVGGYGPHSWVEIEVNGTDYICDPDFQNETGKNGYLIHYKQSGTWKYTSYSRMN